MNKKYVFTGEDMSSGFHVVAMYLFSKFIGRPCNYLEIGVWQGRSGCIVLDDVLIHPSAKYTGVDLYEGEYEEEYLTAWQNIVVGRETKARLLRGNSLTILPKLLLRYEQFDAIFVDGCHSLRQSVHDILASWYLLSPGGILLVDDYGRDDYGVRQACDEFSDNYCLRGAKLVYRDYYIAWEKMV